MSTDGTRLHLPYSEASCDEVLDPLTGKWRYTFATLAHDSWITWRNALPKDEEQWSELTPSVVKKLRKLASELHAVHHVIGGESEALESPWVFNTWWQPGRTGDSCELYFRGVKTDAFLDAVALANRRRPLRCTPLEDPWILVALR